MRQHKVDNAETDYTDERTIYAWNTNNSKEAYNKKHACFPFPHKESAYEVTHLCMLQPLRLDTSTLGLDESLAAKSDTICCTTCTRCLRLLNSAVSSIL